MRAAGKISASRRPAVAWLDDDINYYTAWVSSLEDAGLSLTSFSKQKPLLDMVGRTHFDLIILDERLKGGMGSALLTLLHAKSPKSIFLFLSGYFTEDDLRAKLEGIHREAPDIELHALEKSDMGSVGSEDFNRKFVEKVVGLATGQADDGDAIGADNAERSPGSGRFNIEFSEYRDMQPDDRYSLSEAFLESRRTVIERYFADGAVWLCFFGDSDEPVHVATSRDRIPDLSIIDREAADRGIAPFCIGSPQRIESIHSTSANCSKSGGLQGYNHIAYEVGNERIRTHFDSGSDLFFMNGGWLARRGLMREALSHSVCDTSIGRIWYQDQEVDIILDLSNGETLAVKHKVLAVRNFETSVLVARCGSDCGYAKNSMCNLRRHGLMGRSLLYDNDLRYQVNRDYEVQVVQL